MNVVTPPPESTRSPSLRDSELPCLPANPWTRDPERTALGVLAALVFVVAAWLASPLWVGLVVGAVMAFTAQPLHRRCVARWGEPRRRLIAAIVTLASGLVLLVLGVGALYVLGRELVEGVDLLQRKIAEGATVADLLGPGITRTLERLRLDPSHVDAQVQEWMSQAASKVAGIAATVIAATGSAALTLLLAVVTEYFVLLDWARLGLRLERILPLEPRHTRALFLEFRAIGRGTFVGTVGAGLIQGALATAGYAIAGVPQPVVWGVATAIASLVPVLGTFGVWVPIAVVLLVRGQVAAGIFVAAWGFLVVSAAVDWIVRPKLIGKSRHTHPLLTLVALLGGAQVFGIAGLIAAPIVMSMLLAVLTIYEREIVAVRRGADARRAS
jgi:predicted PurR-regulated permease PerM